MVEESEFSKNGLQIHPCNQQDRKGGGIALIIPTSFKVNQLKTTNFNSFEHAVWRVQWGSTHMMILGIYHPPASMQQKNSNSDFIDDLTELFTTTGSENRDIMLLGDLNLHTDDPKNPDADQLITTLESSGLKKHIKFPTDQLGHTLDLIATESTIQLTQAALPAIYLLDHRLIITETNSKKHKEKSQYMEYRKLDKAAITEFQQSFDNQPIFDATDLEDTIYQLNNKMQRNLDTVETIKRRNVKRPPKLWFKKQLLDQKKNVKSREQKLLKYKKSYQWTSFKRESNCYNNMIKFHKRHDLFSKINQNNTRQLYKIISDPTGQNDINPLP